ncbi:MAG TPA: hypothetical protein VFG35_12660 [Actinoplanes sp.]|nr:hypothetical protein [Actinoplanes sp.]
MSNTPALPRSRTSATEVFGQFQISDGAISDLALKERALARTTPLGTTAGRYQPTDTIVAFLENL